MDRVIGFAATGQVVFFSCEADLLGAGAPEISTNIFRVLKSNIAHASMHTKPVTEGCDQAASVRVTNDLVVGVPINRELKSRMFMAETIEGDPIIIKASYRANSESNHVKLKALLPRDKNGDCLIKLPHALSARKAGKYDLLDQLGNNQSPYTAAADALQLGMGQINPYSVLDRAEKVGIKVLYLYDASLLKERAPLTTNVGHRNLGVFVEDGRDYLELAMASAKPVAIAGHEFKGAVIGDFAEVMKDYKEAPELAGLYRAAGVFEEVLKNSRRSSSIERF